MPFWHAVHLVCAVVLVYEPMAHLPEHVLVLNPDVAPNVPAGHAVHPILDTALHGLMDAANVYLPLLAAALPV